MTAPDLLRRIEQHSNAAAARMREALTVEPFQALLDSSTEMVWVNYAVPIASLEDTARAAAGLEKLRALFEQRGRRLRFEFTEALWPTLPALLEEAGLEVELPAPLMACTAAALRPYAAPGVHVRALTASDPEEELATCLSVQREGFSVQPTSATAEEIATFRQQLADGVLCCALARLEGTPAGAGCTTPIGPTAELGGIATLPALRRRGVAAKVSRFLAEDHFRRGGDLVWLSAGDAIAQAAYERIGFQVIGTRLSYILTHRDDLQEGEE